MKKLGVLFLISLFLVSSIVSAQQILQPIADSAESFYNTIFAPFAKFLLGGNTVTGELFFAKLLLFILITSLVWYAANEFPPTSGKLAFVISVIVSLLAVRYLGQSWVETIVLPYTALGIAITSIIPLVLFFFFVEKGLVGQPVLRRVAWVVAAVVFAGLFLYRSGAPYPADPTGIFNWDGKGLEPGHLYLISSIACLVLMWFDKTIQRTFTKARYENMNEIRKIKTRSDLVDEYNTVRSRLVGNGISADEAKALIKDIRQRAKANGLEENIFELPG